MPDLVRRNLPGVSVTQVPEPVLDPGPRAADLAVSGCAAVEGRRVDHLGVVGRRAVPSSGRGCLRPRGEHAEVTGTGISDGQSRRLGARPGHQPVGRIVVEGRHRAWVGAEQKGIFLGGGRRQGRCAPDDVDGEHRPCSHRRRSSRSGGLDDTAAGDGRIELSTLDHALNNDFGPRSSLGWMSQLQLVLLVTGVKEIERLVNQPAVTVNFEKGSRQPRGRCGERGGDGEDHGRDKYGQGHHSGRQQTQMCPHGHLTFPSFGHHPQDFDHISTGDL